MNFKSLQVKLICTFLFLGLTPMLLVGSVLHYEASQALGDAAEAKNLLRTMLWGLVLSTAFLVTLANWMAARLTRPVHQTRRVCEELAQGDLTARVAVESGDELGELAGALNRAVDQVRGSLQNIYTEAHQVADSSRELKMIGDRVGENAVEVSSRAEQTAAASEQISVSVNEVASAAEEMRSSIREIAKNSVEAARIAAAAVQVAVSTTDVVTRLGQNSADIGKVIRTITNIAEQTNMLALNATIEAARAGELGRGFAVVANEVKELARETGQASLEIGRQLETVQTETESVVTAIAQISEIIGRINDISNSIAGAVEQQSATTQAIVHSVTEAARGVADIAHSSQRVAVAASDTSADVVRVRAASEALTELSTSLHSLVARFRLEQAA